MPFVGVVMCPERERTYSSCFAVGRELVLTTEHVFAFAAERGAGDLRVAGPGLEPAPFDVVLRDRLADVAVLRVPGAELVPFEVSEPVVGQDVTLTGWTGQWSTVATTVVGLRDVRYDGRRYEALVHRDPAGPGFCGGPVVAAGAAVGMHCVAWPRTGRGGAVRLGRWMAAREAREAEAA
jgi:S1-C subfamily serine protease